MCHPFDLNPSELDAIELDFVETLADQEAAQVSGGFSVTTQALGEEGGDCWTSIPFKSPHKRLFEQPGKPIIIDEPIFTTLALGEEGGDCVE